ncbi:bacteriocin [Marinifilum sp. RC60d5]|uniref:bacteriocin n=1 Tax=Marinifilum sp. RC60d5 TaxID=3458414 RepID=UPI0040365EA6
MKDLNEKELKAINGGMEYWDWVWSDKATTNPFVGLACAAANAVVAVERGVAWVANQL